ncbi:hypothetical protein A2U01_0063651, partial [Trifolium medium]|nr:hypothetical protein [Trifolium medium]
SKFNNRLTKNSSDNVGVVRDGGSVPATARRQRGREMLK